MDTVKKCNIDKHSSAFDTYDRSVGHMGGIINPPGVTSTKQYATLYNHADPLKAAIGRAKAAAAAVNGCVAFSIKNKPEGSGIDNYTVKFFNEECFEEGELMSQSDFTTYVWNENNYQAMVEAERDGTEDTDKSFAAQGNGKFMQSSIGGAERRTYRVEADAKEEPQKEKKPGRSGGMVDPGIKQELKKLMTEEFVELKHMLTSQQRRKETEADATFKDFYKNKYRRSHMHNSRFVDTNHKYAKGAAGDLGATKGGALTRSVLDNSLPQQSSGSLFDTIGPFDENAPILDQWNPVSSRLHQHTTVAMEGTGSSWSYQYGKDHVSHRGPPYQINNTKAVWQR